MSNLAGARDCFRVRADQIPRTGRLKNAEVLNRETCALPSRVEWPCADHPPEDSLYLWGPDVPTYFVENTEAER
jgi:hypothetical protein